MDTSDGLGEKDIKCYTVRFQLKDTAFQDFLPQNDRSFLTMVSKLEKLGRVDLKHAKEIPKRPII